MFGGGFESNFIRTVKSKQKSKELFSAMTNKQQPFRSGPLLGHQRNKGRGQDVRSCSPEITHNVDGNQANNNTKINIVHSFKESEVKLCQSKVVPPNKISLSYPQCFNVSRVHPFVRPLFPTNSISEVPLAGRLKFFFSNWAKLTQDLNILNIIQGFEIPFLQKLVVGKPPNPPVMNQEQPKLVKEWFKEILLKGAIQPVSLCKNQHLSNLFLVSKRD